MVGCERRAACSSSAEALQGLGMACMCPQDWLPSTVPYQCVAWFPGPVHMRARTFEFPMPTIRLQPLIQLHVGPHSLSVEQDRHARPVIPQHLRRCALCTKEHRGMKGLDSDGPQFAHSCHRFWSLYQDADGTMQHFVWHMDQKAVHHCSAANLILTNDSDKNISSLGWRNLCFSRRNPQTW